MFRHPFRQSLALLLLGPTYLIAVGCHTLPVEFNAVSELHQDKMGPSLLGGSPANPDDYPASFFARVDGQYCTSTLVASRVALTAAHCVIHGGSISLKLSGKNIVGRCDMAAGSATESGVDWTLCLLDQEIRGVTYENINSNSQLLTNGPSIKLTGFGCTNPDGSGGNDNVFREGLVTVAVVQSHHGTVLQTKGSVALCPGDSGGAAFFGFDPGYTRRVIVAVNSHFTRDPVSGEYLLISYLASVADPTAQTYFKNWINRNGVLLCGIFPSPAGCRSE
jgi:hypothetical protein